LLTASRRLEAAPLSRTFSMRCGFCDSSQNEARCVGELCRLPGWGPSTPNSPFSPVDRFCLLTDLFGPGSQVAGTAIILQRSPSSMIRLPDQLEARPKSLVTADCFIKDASAGRARFRLEIPIPHRLTD